VGTKLKIIFVLDKHNTIGNDLVGMCGYDILTCGAELLFLEIAKGIAEGCKEARRSLIGGEKAEISGYFISPMNMIYAGCCRCSRKVSNLKE